MAQRIRDYASSAENLSSDPQQEHQVAYKHMQLLGNGSDTVFGLHTTKIMYTATHIHIIKHNVIFQI